MVDEEYDEIVSSPPVEDASAEGADAEASPAAAAVTERKTRKVKRIVPAPEPPQKVVLGQLARKALQEGEALDDESIVALVVVELLEIQRMYDLWKSSPPDSNANEKPTCPQVCLTAG